LTAFLLDVNVLVALLWPPHSLHAATQRWFARKAGGGWATCPFTQAGFVRIIMNPNVSGGGLRCRDAVGILEDRLRDAHHRFWSDDIGLPEAVAPFRDRLLGHRKVTDAYLLGLAMHHGGKLATLDRGMLNLLGEDSRERGHIELIRA